MKWRRHWLAAWVAILVCIFLSGDFLLFRIANFNADNVTNFNELAAIFDRNFLLHGWSLASDNFYLTDLPFYVIGDLIFGRSPSLIYIVPYTVFIFFIGGCIGLVWRTGRTPLQRLLAICAVLLLLGLPYGTSQTIFLVSDDHAAGIMITVFVILTAEIYLANPSRYPRLPLLAGGLIFIVAASDQLVDFYLTAAVIAVGALRLWSHRRLAPHEAWLMGSIVAFTVIGTAFPLFLAAHGGFSLRRNFSLELVSFIPQLIDNLRAILIDLTLLSDARAGSLVGIVGAPLIAAAHGLAAFIVLGLLLKIILDIPVRQSQPLPQWLVMGAVTLAFVEMFSRFFAFQSGGFGAAMPIGALRLVAPVYVVSVLAAILEAQHLFSRLRWQKWRQSGLILGLACAVLILAGAVQAFALAFRGPAFPHNQAQIAVAQWLAARNFTYGFGDYWSSQMVTAFSAGRVKTDSIEYTDHIVPGNWDCDMADLRAGRPPQFVVFLPGDTSFMMPGTNPLTIAEITQAYGQPKAVYDVSGYEIVVLRTADQ